MVTAMPRRALPLLLLAALAMGCSSPLLARPSGPGLVHARVVSGAGGSRLMIVPVSIAGHGPYDFALDTGAARSVIDSRVATDLRLPTTGREQTVTGVSGTSEAIRVRVNSWRVDSVALPDTTILSLRLPAGSGPSLSGLLGSDMLSRFHTVTLDYEGQTVTLR
jgi:Aspartyl protease